MLRKFALTTILLMLTLTLVKPSIAHAKTNEISPAQNEAAIQELFGHYMAKYNHYLQSGQLEHQPSLYHNEVMVISDNSAPTMVTELALYGQVEKFLDRLKSRGVTKVNWQKVDIHLLGNNMALASNVAIRYNQAGEVVDRVGASYTLYQLNNQWKIAAFAIHDVNNAFEFQAAVEKTPSSR
ncbi:MAG: hypothetical protein HWE13_10610 [Gammaproteobacteria bacterium]|nr:hypothetical protein [Gammaproteobacteria bacterium]NVK88572.1 hypothetical protein [Gammaproteobacteria bacterium]